MMIKQAQQRREDDTDERKRQAEDPRHNQW